jgi:hypothetical protein
VSNESSPPPKKRLSGCALAALIVGGIVVAGVITLVIGGLWFFNRSEVGMALRDTMIEASQAQSAPGTAQMRAAGCMTASSMNLTRMVNLGRSRVRDEQTRADLERMVGVFGVFCVSSTLTCEQVAAAWGEGAPSDARSAMVSVTSAGGNQAPRCSGHFDRTGAPLPEVDGFPAGPPFPGTTLPAEAPIDPGGK